MKKIIIILFLSSVTVLLNAQEPVHKYYFYVHNDYSTQGELYHTLFNDIGNSDELFLWCCDCIMFYARVFEISYNTMNLILFVFLQPFIIFVFFLLILKQKFKIEKLKRKILLG